MTTATKTQEQEPQVTSLDAGESRVGLLTPEKVESVEAHETLPTIAESLTAAPAQPVAPPEEGVLTALAKAVVALYDWLSGPAMTKQERLHREIAEANIKQFIDLRLR